jgi:membrane protein DedA with SNARE-associated domain
MVTPDSLVTWLAQYGSFALFGLLALGIVGLPIPDETLMTFAGAMLAKGYLDVIPTVLSAYAGSFFGISLSYFIGRTAGTYLVKQYGSRIGLTEERIIQVHLWFEKIGKWTLLVGYFFPGVRHLTGYVAGSTELDFKRFAIFAYTGGFLWVTLFLLLGYFSTRNWEHVLQFMIDNLENMILLISFVVVLGFLARAFYRKKDS